MLPDRVSNPGPLTYVAGALPIAIRGPAKTKSSTSKLSASLWLTLTTFLVFIRSSLIYSQFISFNLHTYTGNPFHKLHDLTAG